MPARSLEISELWDAEHERVHLGDPFVIYRILFVVSVALTFWWMFRVGEGEREFKESQQALRHVTSWRQEARIGSQDGEQAEIMCSDRGRWLRYPTSQSKEGRAASVRKFESVEIGPKSYSRSPGKASEWKPEYAPTVTAACEKLRRGDYLYPLPDYDHLIEQPESLREQLTQSKG